MNTTSNTTSPYPSTNCLGLIPARANSKGVPGKNARPLLGRPLIDYTFSAAMQSRLIDRVIVSTDSHYIAELAKEAGVAVPFMRPAELALDATPTLPVVQHALDTLEAMEEYVPDIVVLLQPTTPLRTSQHVDEAVERLISSQADAVVSVTEVPGHFSPHWQFRVEGGTLALCDGRRLEDIIPRRQELPVTYIRNGAIYAFRTSSFRQTRSFDGRACAPYIMPDSVSVNIDTMADWNRAEKHLQRDRSINEAS